MARRGSNSFKRNDAIRAIRSAKDAGIEPTMIEIVANDGTTFRVYGDRACPTGTAQESADTKAWDEAISKSTGEPKKGRGGGKSAAD